MKTRRPYPTDLTDDQWARPDPYLPPQAADGRPRRIPVRELLESSLFQRAYADLQAGVDLCRRTCRYFPFCGGGFPSNKLTETGTFASAETKYCLSQIQPVIDVVLASHEKEIGLAPTS